MKTLDRLEVFELIEQRYGKKVSFEVGVNKLKQDYICTVLNQGKSKQKRYSICESALK